MSSIWYEYLEETGGEIIPLNNFRHVVRSLEKSGAAELVVNCSKDEVKFAFNYDSQFWWPVSIIDQLSEGWVRLRFYGAEPCDNSLWCDLNGRHSTVIRSVKWCCQHDAVFKPPSGIGDANIDAILEQNRAEDDAQLEYAPRSICAYQSIKTGAYLECWLENSVGFVWPVKVLSNIGGRLKLVWFGCDCAGKCGGGGGGGNNGSGAFFMFYLDHRLHCLGWARANGWKYSPPGNIGISISISNVDTFVRGSPSAFAMDMGCDRELRQHFFEEGWQLEAVNPLDPARVHCAVIRYVLDGRYFLVELERDPKDAAQTEPVMFPAFGGMAELLPANTSSISGYSVVGLCGDSWDEHLAQAGGKYAPHLGYFQTGSAADGPSAFLPGCKLEAVVPWNRSALHAATVVRAMDGSRLVWLRSDSDPDAADWLVDPATSTELFPAGWSEMVGHPLVLPPAYVTRTIFPAPLDPDDIVVNLRPQCFLGPYLSRSLAMEILPRVIGPGHCVPVFRELFHLLLKVSHKPYKLMRLLQLDSCDDRHELMAVIGVPSPKTEWGGRAANKRADWLVEVAVRRRAVAGFCRQTALALGACPSFISASSSQSVQHRAWCDARLAAKAGEKMSQQRRKRLFLRPLTALGISYRELKARGTGGNVSSGTNSELESDEREESGPLPPPVLLPSEQQSDTTAAAETTVRMCTRGMRLVVPESRLRRQQQRASKRNRPTLHLKSASARRDALSVDDDQQQECVGMGRDSRGRNCVTRSAIDVREYVIDPMFLAGDIERVTLTSNPVLWSVEQLTEYLSGTDCRQLITWLAHEKVDGRAFLLLTLPVLSTLYGLQLEVAIRLCRHVVSLKRVFVEQYADMQELLPDDIS